GQAGEGIRGAGVQPATSAPLGPRERDERGVVVADGDRLGGARRPPRGGGGPGSGWGRGRGAGPPGGPAPYRPRARRSVRYRPRRARQPPRCACPDTGRRATPRPVPPP